MTSGFQELIKLQNKLAIRYMNYTQLDKNNNRSDLDLKLAKAQELRNQYENEKL